MLHVGQNLTQDQNWGKKKVESVLEGKMYPGRSLPVSGVDVEGDDYQNDLLFQVLKWLSGKQKKREWK